MGVKVKGVKQVANNINHLIDSFEGRRTVRAIYSALYYIGIESAVKVPVDTSTLLNSQFRDVTTLGTRIIGKIGYSVKYAAAVHEAKGIHLGTKTPRPVKPGQKPGSRGNIWDKTGEPKFLEKPAEDARAKIHEIIAREMSL
ncbi:hypothetical protein [Erwinia sp. Leaf53]|uniref:hypothetical protein n=1 Tax=Erwinia sp. Leaf53 TaxID=1736225 RepID=UPI0006F7F4CF|nr:hypothetical protein [Erwinia sp. Leaf53]KQN53208.1 hypothetical protein ASF13_16560 [Erwinia sp. Leaf53]